MTEPAELDYDVEATHYPADEPEQVTQQLMGLTSEILHRRRELATRPEPDPVYPEIGRYRELSHAVECLIDCAGQPLPDYRERLLGIAALALDAVIRTDSKTGRNNTLNSPTV
ncbi:hypothetical protein [Azospirillum argentinense]|uniref:Uncharacterized protein n=1 Tax=Azospirillum argentinense TaxID=2970906 RepID=A0A5B0KPM9_9PROT|nr:hypothetical protein [Azospirillum argentinense]KAA1053915.1 hypothetical protein FH063_002497 [Azospirillum argentinense]